MSAKFSLSKFFPAQNKEANESGLTPLFYRGLFFVALAVFVCIWLFGAWGKLEDVIAVIILAFFLSLAVEPIVVRIIRSWHWSRRVAAGFTIGVLTVVVLTLMAVSSSLLVSQLVNFFSALPDNYVKLEKLFVNYFGFQLPDGNVVFSQLVSSKGQDLAGQAFGFGYSFLHFLLDALMLILIVYSLVAYAPDFKKTVVGYFETDKQAKIIRVWNSMVDRVGSYLWIRIVLSLITTIFLSAVLFPFGVSYWFALAVFVAILSQFIPLLGTYIGTALLFFVSLTSRDMFVAVIVLVIFVVYQQLIDYLLLPLFSQKALDINPAIAFISVISFASLWGALGAFLALPVVAIISDLLSNFFARHEIDPDLVIED